ncbi:MAG: damage-inducible protein [Alphaproteobacteria bacterium PA3]|nr:MAG: damage-inducible protein [Alphaproteobacteria bacterium PA3]
MSTDLNTLFALGVAVGDKLAARGETIAVAESSAGGLLSAALLARAGASAYYFGGAVLYTRRSRRLLTTLTSDDTVGMRSSSPPYAKLLAAHQRTRFKATWGLAETGAAGPSGNTYGDPAGHTCLAVDGPVQRYHLPGLHAMNLVIAGALDGGGPISQRLDPLGKGMAQMLLELPITVPADWAG